MAVSDIAVSTFRLLNLWHNVNSLPTRDEKGQCYQGNEQNRIPGQDELNTRIRSNAANINRVQITPGNRREADQLIICSAHGVPYQEKGGGENAQAAGVAEGVDTIDHQPQKDAGQPGKQKRIPHGDRRSEIRDDMAG